MDETASVSDTSNISISSENEGDLTSHLHTHINNFAIDFESIIKILQVMIIEARNKKTNIGVTKNSDSEDTSTTSYNSTSSAPPSIVPPVVPTGLSGSAPPSTVPLVVPTGPSGSAPPSTVPLVVPTGPSGSAPPSTVPLVVPTGPSGSAPPSTVPLVVPTGPSGSAPPPSGPSVVPPATTGGPVNNDVDTNDDVNPDNEPIADDNDKANLKPSPDPPTNSDGQSTPATPIGPPINMVPSNGTANSNPNSPNSNPFNPNPPSPKPFTVTMAELEARLKKLKEDDMTASPSETDKKLQLVYDISGSLAQHINIISNISNKTPQLNYANNLFLTMLNNSLTNINTTRNQSLGSFNIMIPRKPDMKLINNRLKNVTINNLKDLKQLLGEFNAESTDSDEQTKTLLNIYNIAEKIPFICKRDERKTLPIPVIIQPQSENNINVPIDGDEISQLKQQLLDKINTNILQLQQLSIELLQKNMELQQLLAEYSIGSNSDVIKTAYVISKSLDGYVTTVTDEMNGEEMLKQQINDRNMTEEILKEKIQDNTDIINKVKATITGSMNDANKIISQLRLAKTSQQSPQTSPDSSTYSSPDSSTSSLSYSTTTNNSLSDSSLIGVNFINPSEYATEIQGLRTRINKLKQELPNPSYGSNIFEILDNILNMLDKISSDEKTLVTTETNKKYMSNILFDISSIVNLITFCKVSDNPGYCDTINNIPSNIPNTSIVDVTPDFVNTNLPQIDAYLKQILTNIVSKVKDKAQGYIDTLNKIIGEDNSGTKSTQIKEVMEKIITFMTGGVLKDITAFDSNVLPNYNIFIDLIGKIGTLLNSVSNFHADASYTNDVNDIQFYLIKTVINMLNCMFINNDNQKGCALGNSRGKIKVKQGTIQSEINDVNKIVKIYNVSNFSSDNINILRNELADLFPGVNVPGTASPFTFGQDMEDETLNMADSSRTLEHPLGLNGSIGSVSTNGSLLSEGTNQSTDTKPKGTTEGIINNDQTNIDNNSNSENSLNKSQVDSIPSRESDISNQSMNISKISDLTESNYSTSTAERPHKINDSMMSLSSQGTKASTDTTKNVNNDNELTTESNNIDDANIEHIKQQISKTINRFTDLNNKLKSNDTILGTNEYIFWDKTNTMSTRKFTNTTQQIIDKINTNNNHFITLLELLRNSITDTSLSNEYSITRILTEINNLIDTTKERFDYKDYEKELISLYTELRRIMTTTLGINITDVSKYPPRLTGGGMNDKIRFTYKRKRGTKRAKKSKPTRRRKYTPNKKNYYY